MAWLPDRTAAWELFSRYTTQPHLIKHGIAVEAAMRYMARKHNEDEELWAVVGLLHDFDYEQFPTEADHPYKGAEILKEQGYPQEVIDAIMGHAPYTGVVRETLMAKMLFAVDELSGFVIACALVRPDKALSELKLKSVTKRMKSSGFARGVNRDDIILGAHELGVELDELIPDVIEALKPVAEQVGVNP